MTNDELRDRVIEEAKTWLRTPFHHAARVKGAGVDCLMFLAEVYERAGVVGHIDPPFYVPDWYMHRNAETYFEGLLQYAGPIDAPQKADIALFKHGRTFSHGAIVVEWPRVIHAYWEEGVVWGDANLLPLITLNGVRREVKFFTPFTTSPG